MKQNATRKCKQIQRWNVNRFTRKIKFGTKLNKLTGFIGRSFAFKNKKLLIKACLNDTIKSYKYYKDKNDYNNKKDRIENLIKNLKITMKMTPKQSKDMKKKWKKNILEILKS